MDAEEALELLYALTDLTPSQAYALSPYEAAKVLEGRGKAVERRDQRTAWIVATIINWAGKQLKKGREVTPKELLKRPGPKKDPQKTRERIIDRFNLTKRFGVEA